jgi:hypothetical protein
VPSGRGEPVTFDEMEERMRKRERRARRFRKRGLFVRAAAALVFLAAAIWAYFQGQPVIAAMFAFLAGASHGALGERLYWLDKGRDFFAGEDQDADDEAARRLTRR